MYKNLALCLCLLLAACAPSADSVSTAIAKTQDAMPTVTQAPTETAKPSATVTTQPSRTPAPTNTTQPTRTATSLPAATATATVSLEVIKQNFLDALADVVEKLSDVESVTLVRFNQGALEMELKTKWASQDSQADVSYKVILAVAPFFKRIPSDNIDRAAGGHFVFALTTYSTQGDYRYQSNTDYDTMIKVADRAISYEEWVTLSNAGFR